MAEKIDLNTLPKGLTKEEFTALPNFKKDTFFFYLGWCGIYWIRDIDLFRDRKDSGKRISGWWKL